MTRIAQVYSVGEYTPDELMALATLAPGNGPADTCIRSKAATLPRPASNLRVIRGDAGSILAKAGMERTAKRKFSDAYEASRILGHHIETIAVAEINPLGKQSDFYVQGFISLDAATEKKPGNEWVRVELWSRSLRFQHWANVLLIILMSLTGYYIMDPFFGGQGDTGFLMGWIRAIHFLAGFAWCAMGIWRLSLWLFARQRQLRWRALWPLDSQRDVQGLVDTVLYYCFIKKHHAPYLAHNPLQQFAYTAIYVLCLIQLLTGLALFGLYDQSSTVWATISYPVHLIGIPMTRLIHAALMFILWAFVVIHVYLAVRADTQETHGGISSMLNGGVWVKRGSKPLDAHRIGEHGLKI